MEDTVEAPETRDDPPARAARVMERLLAAADVARVYGAPISREDTLVIPAAEVLAVAGFGLGGGSGSAPAADGGERRGRGGGGGGGGRTLARSVAVIVVSRDGVRVKPVFDFTKIALAALTAAGFVWASWRGMDRRAHRHRWLAGR
jgi:uncharacterized spore protein YtfJ